MSNLLGLYKCGGGKNTEWSFHEQHFSNCCFPNRWVHCNCNSTISFWLSLHSWYFQNPNLLLDYRSFLQISNRFLEGLTWIQKNDKSSVRAESMSAHLLLLQLWAQRPTHGRQTTSVEVKNWRANKEPSLQEMLSSVLSRQGAQVTDHWSLGLLTSMAFSYSCYLNMEFLSQFSTIMILIDINQRECLLLSIIHVMITTLRARTKANQRHMWLKIFGSGPVDDGLLVNSMLSLLYLSPVNRTSWWESQTCDWIQKLWGKFQKLRVLQMVGIRSDTLDSKYYGHQVFSTQSESLGISGWSNGIKVTEHHVCSSNRCHYLVS